MAKSEKDAILKLNQAVKNAAKFGIYVGGLSLQNSKNVWTFFGSRVLVNTLTANSDTLIQHIETELAESNGEKMKEMVELGNPNYQTCKVLPPLPNKIENITVVNARAYVSHAIAILTGVHDMRLAYSQPPPTWWPSHIPFNKPGLVPQQLMQRHGNSAASIWHKCLKNIIYYAHQQTQQDFRMNVDSKGWDSFMKKNHPGMTHLSGTVIEDGAFPEAPEGLLISSEELWGLETGNQRASVPNLSKTTSSLNPGSLETDSTTSQQSSDGLEINSEGATSTNSADTSSAAAADIIATVVENQSSDSTLKQVDTEAQTSLAAEPTNASSSATPTGEKAPEKAIAGSTALDIVPGNRSNLLTARKVNIELEYWSVGYLVNQTLFYFFVVHSTFLHNF